MFVLNLDTVQVRLSCLGFGFEQGRCTKSLKKYLDTRSAQVVHMLQKLRQEVDLAGWVWKGLRREVEGPLLLGDRESNMVVGVGMGLGLLYMQETWVQALAPAGSDPQH